MKPSTASAVTSMMEAVVKEGTGTDAQIPGMQVAGKTGTAQTQIGDAINNVWFIAFAPARDPRVAVAVTLKAVPGKGAAFAAPVARAVMERLLRMIEPGTMIDGRYRVISRLGSGGMADVYLAQDQLLGREVAVKVLHHHFAEDHEFVERFRREASSAAALSHPNIVGDLRPRRVGRHLLHSDGVRRRTLAQDDRARSAVALEPAARSTSSSRSCAPRARAPAWGDPPRSQAPQRDRRRRGPRARHRFRHRPRRRLGHDAHRLDHGHRPVPVARAGAGLRGHRRLGPVLGRRDPLRAADRGRSVRG